MPLQRMIAASQQRLSHTLCNALPSTAVIMITARLVLHTAPIAVTLIQLLFGTAAACRFVCMCVALITLVSQLHLKQVKAAQLILLHSCHGSSVAG